MSKVVRISEDLHEILKEVAQKSNKKLYQVTYRDLAREEILEKLEEILNLLDDLRSDIEDIKSALEKAGVM